MVGERVLDNTGTYIGWFQYELGEIYFLVIVREVTFRANE
jgi:hypothetical protein